MPRGPARLAVHAKAGHHLVEDEHGAVAVAHGAQPLQETLARQYQAHVARDGLDDDAGDFSRSRLEHAWTATRSLYGVCSSCRRSPPERGRREAEGRAPEPAFTRRKSAWPW